MKPLLSKGADGSKIIVTTRSQRVSEIIGTVTAYNLSLLGQEDCLSLFSKCAFKEGQKELQDLQPLVLASDGLEELSKDVRYMTSLRFLCLVTEQKRLPECGIGCLECLQTLFIF